MLSSRWLHLGSSDAGPGREFHDPRCGMCHRPTGPGVDDQGSENCLLGQTFLVGGVPPAPLVRELT